MSWSHRLCDRLRSSGDVRLVDRYRSPLSPALAYGRHRGPVVQQARRAAVVVAMFSRQWPGVDLLPATLPEDAMLVLTQRPGSLQHHGGQICLPGGKIELGERSLDAALREFEEELGVAASVVMDFGRLATQFVYASSNCVTPHVLWVCPPSRPWRPDPIEVERVIEISVADLVRKSIKQEYCRDVVEARVIEKNGESAGILSFQTPGFVFGDDHVWGATSMILDELARHLHHSMAVAGRPAN